MSSLQNWLFAVIIPGVIFGLPSAAAVLVYQRSMSLWSPTPLASLLLTLRRNPAEACGWRTRLVAEWGAFTATTIAGFSMIIVTKGSLFDGMVPLAIVAGHGGAALLLTLADTAKSRLSIWRRVFVQTVVLFLAWQFLWIGLWVTSQPIHGSGLVQALPSSWRLYLVVPLPSIGFSLATSVLGLVPVVTNHVEIPGIPDAPVAVTASVSALSCFVILERGLFGYSIINAAEDGFAVALVITLVASVRTLLPEENLQSDTP